jgi:hypothetical protein
MNSNKGHLGFGVFIVIWSMVLTNRGVLPPHNYDNDNSKNLQFFHMESMSTSINSTTELISHKQVLKSGLNYTARTAHNVCDPNYRLIKIFSILQWPNLLLCVCIFFVSFFAQQEKKLNYSFSLHSKCLFYLLHYFSIL